MLIIPISEMRKTVAEEEEVRQRESTVPTGPSALPSPQTSGLSLGFQLQNKQRGRCPDDGFERLEKQESLPRELDTELDSDPKL